MKKIYIFEYICYISIVLLIVAITIWNAFIYPSENIPRLIPILIYDFPLLILIYKLRENQFSTYVMTSYLMLLYFVVGIGNLTNDKSFNIGLILSVLSLVTFTSAIFYIREKNNLKN